MDSIGVDRLAEAIAEAVTRVPVYRELVGTPAWAEVTHHARDHATATLRSLRSGAPPGCAELQFVVHTGVHRARQGVPLSAVLHAYRAGFGVVWSLIRSESARLGVEAEVVVRLGGTAVDYFNAISTTVADAYLGEAQAVRAAALQERRTIVERLVSGTPQRPDVRLADHGLDDPRLVFVLVVKANEDGELERVSQRLAVALERELQHAVLCAVTRQRVVAVLGATDAARAAEVEARVAAVGREAQGGAFGGLSTARAGLGEVPAAFGEAERALRQATAERPLVVLSRARLFDDLMSRADQTTLRLVPAWARELVEEDAASTGELCETVVAYLGDELSVARCAKRLGVHPNTVRYRLARIESITGMSTRVFDDLVEIVIALRLLQGTPLR